MDHKLMERAIDAMELLDIYLNEGRLIRDKNFDYGAQLQDVRQQSKLSVTADILSSANGQGDTGKRGAILRALVTVGVRFVATAGEGIEDEKSQKDQKGQPGSTVMGEIEATFCAMYRYSNELSDDELAEFLRFNAVHNVWPFWREHALRVAAESKLPRPSIPLMKPQNA